MSTNGKKSTVDQNQWVFLANENCLEVSPDGENRPTICKLRHPKSDSTCLCMFTHGDSKMYEITQHKEPFRSWFIGDTVQHDGSIFLTVPADPVYYALPYLIKAGKNGKFVPLEQLIHDDDYPECSRLCHCDSMSDLDQVAEVKGGDDFRAYRYNQDHTLSWLRLKVERVAITLQSKNFNVSDAGQLETFVQSKTTDTNREDYMRYAFGLVSEYLPVELSTELKTFLGIKDIVHEKPIIQEPPAKRAKTGAVEPSEDYSEKGIKVENNNKKLTSAQKKLSKIDKTGMKSISSFFAKPSRKK